MGTLVEIVKAFKVYDSSIKTNHLTLGKRVLPEHLLIANGNHKNVIGFLSTGSQGFTPRIKNFNELTTLHKNIKFTLLRDPREPQIKSQGGSTAIEKLNYTPNGEFVMMDKVMRVHFELISKMIVDIYEGDLEAEIPEAIEVFKSKYSHCWLIRKIFST